MTAATLCAHLDDFLAMKPLRTEVDARCSLERRQRRYREGLLRNFLEFWKTRGCPWPIRSGLALEWAAVGSRVDRPYRDRHRMWAIRAFLRQVRAFEPRTEIPPIVFRPGRRRRRPFVFSDKEIRRLMEAPHQLRLVDAFRRRTLVTLIGLLASTGLRIGEALRLNIDDTQLVADPPHLLIRDTKFGKSRVVVLHPSTADQLRAYLALRATALRRPAAVAFFASIQGRPLNYITTRFTFQRLLRHAGIHAAAGQRAPTLHSFRHTFAVNRLTRWHRERRNVEDWLPHLSVYLGHLGPASTYWYVSATPELLQTAAGLMDALGQEGVVQ
jgi:integrase/recombinase XerD